MFIEIGVYEATTRLPELLRNVQAGRSYVITVGGSAVAKLIPARVGRPEVQDVIARIRAMQKPADTVAREEIASWKSEGRC